MDLFTLSAINLVIGLFTAIHLGLEFRKDHTKKYLLDLSLTGLCLVFHSIMAMIRESVQLPYFLLPALVNTVTVIIHLLVLSALHRLFQVPLQRKYLVVLVLVSYLLLYLPALQQDQLNRLLFAFSIIVAMNVLCLRLLAGVKQHNFANVVTFFKYILLFNISQMVLRSGLFIAERSGITSSEPNPLVYQLGWFGLTIYAGLILTAGLMVLSRQRQLEVEIRAERDPLTGLLNRFSMHDRLNAEINRCQRSHQPLTLLMFDIDHFKLVNDNFGHQAGDQVIREVAAITQTTYRDYDLVFRIGGEEFLVCLPGVGQEQAAEKAELLRQQIAARPILPELTVTVSIGFVVATQVQDLDTLVKQADDALYQAKGLGRNQSVGWTTAKFNPELPTSEHCSLA